MRKLPHFVDMAKTPEEIKEDTPSYLGDNPPAQPLYPWGLGICLGQDELEKLDLDSDVDVGEMLHLFCIAKVTSINKNDTTDGTKTRIELQITHIACESEDEENEEVQPVRKAFKSPYK